MAEEEVWTVRRMLDWMQGYLERKGDESPRLSAQWLLSDATGLTRIELYADLERPLSSPELDTLRDHVARRAQGEPLQYLTGSAPFRHLTMKVRPGVLIPRPETEVLVSEVLALLPSPERIRSREFLAEVDEEDVEAALFEVGSASELVFEERATFADEDAAGARAEELLVADIGTGSGCIACSLVHEHPRIRAVATDISSVALETARENARECGVEERIGFYEGDLGSAVPWELEGSFAAVVSNPPYIPTDVLASMPREVVDFEPDLALAGGSDGLDVFRRLLPWAFEALADSGFLACELHETCLEAAASLARAQGFADARIVNDLAGRPRVLIAAKTLQGDEGSAHGA